MGNVLSSAPTRERDVDNVTSESETMGDTDVLCDDSRAEHSNKDTMDAADDEALSKAKEDEMVEFRRQLTIKREQRKEILARHRSEKEELEKSLQNERESKLELCESNKLLRELLIRNNIEIPENLHSDSENSEITDMVTKMREEFEILKSSNMKLRRDLADTNSALQEANSDIADLNSQNRESMKQINALKEVVTVSKTMINLREQQLNDLKNKLNEIERTLADRETNLLSADLRQEYERQLRNIRTLRGLYEERARLVEVTRQGLVRELDEHKILYQAEVKKSQNLTARVDELEEKVDSLLETIDDKNIQISTCQDETNVLKAEMAVVNKLFSQVLLGYKTNQDLDKLFHRLEENHGLLTQMAEKENGSEASSALPKLLLELVSQVEENENKDNKPNNDDDQVQDPTSEQMDKNLNPPSTTAEDIVENLPKVWKVLIELLSHQNVAEENSSEEKVTTCYKSVETKSGPVLVPSVSQTYIRLKNLIVEKLGLITEVNRMKQLNTHLETRLEEQERRLCLVTNELSKTWHVVGRLRRHHHQLHTHEKILKYELQQKRKLLNELKEELEYCREKWEQAREKNTQSERDYKKLRAEFTSRKTKLGSPSFNNSGESGYSDERPSDESSASNDESEHVTEPLVRCKRKMKSFETILDSSTDFNLAEREDPASDMLDVAELPLDAQESEENRDATSEPSKSEHIHKNGKLCDETEDEIGDITRDNSCAEESSTEQILIANNENISEIHAEPNENPATCSETSLPIPVVDSAEILRNIQLQKERLAKKDEKLTNLESNSESLLQKVLATNQFGDEINNTLGHLINRPTTSLNVIDNIETDVELPKAENVSMLEGCKSRSNEAVLMENNDDTKIITEELLDDINFSGPTKQPSALSQIAQTQLENNIDQVPEIKQEVESKSTDEVSSSSEDNAAQVEIPNFKAILENIKNQNERLAKRDERFEKLENGCSQVVSSITRTLETGDKMITQLDTLHNEQQIHGSKLLENEIELNEKDQEEAMPSTSNEIDHEARFAARDLRLKRLEEQTKSLVKKVNNTTSKGVRINYKLDELHNIYGSESSRAGTPSEENEDKNDDEENDE